MWKVVEAADESLREAKRAEFQQRWEKIRKGKEAVENNKKKFRPFIREKQGKIEDGLSRIEKEKHLQNQIVKDMKDLTRDFKIHNLAKRSIEKCCQDRERSAEFLETVVESNKTLYSDIRCLINRAKALMETKNKLSSRLMNMEAEISTEAEAVEKMNDEKMIRALNSNVKLGCLQSVFEKLAASVMERKTCLENKEREVTRKRLLIARLRMAVVTMHHNVRRDAVILPGDKRFEDETVGSVPPKSVDEMMEVIKHHIEDLVMVNSRVLGSEKPQGYIWALASEKSHLRIDY